MAKYRIDTVADVEKFLRHVLLSAEGGLGLGWDFHPDDDFTKFGKADADEQRFSDEEAEELNRALDRCFEVCEKLHKSMYVMTLTIQKNECE